MKRDEKIEKNKKTKKNYIHKCNGSVPQKSGWEQRTELRAKNDSIKGNE